MAKGSMIIAKEGDTLMPDSMFVSGEMPDTGRDGAYMKWDAKDLRHFITAPQSNITKAQAGLFRQVTAV
jgi:hypothetical protein